MALRYLFGPVSATFANQRLQGPRTRGECLVFDTHDGCDLTIGLEDTWDSVTPRLPADWKPDFVALSLAYKVMPSCLWTAPVPIVGLAEDWNLLWHYYQHCLPLCDVVLTDTVGVEIMARHGLHNALTANLYGLDKSFIESFPATAVRDIDILFVGNFNPAVQRARLQCIGRLTNLASRWRVAITTGVNQSDYRKLLARARIVFNHSIRGECNGRALEATAAGAMLVQEAENREIDVYFESGKDYVRYHVDDLEKVLEYYLEHEEERCQIAEAGRKRASQFGFEQLWNQVVDRLGQGLDGVGPKAKFTLGVEKALLMRTWQLIQTAPRNDPTLHADLQRALVAFPRHANLHHALAVVLAYTASHDISSDPHAVVSSLQQTLLHDPTNVTARLNLAEYFSSIGEKTRAADDARHALCLLQRYPTLSPEAMDAPHIPSAFDHFRVEWERAAWLHAGSLVEEANAKRQLLLWRLHSLLASLTGDLSHFYEAVALRHDLPNSQAALGCALARANHVADAVPHLQRAVESNPFDLPAANALYQALGEVDAWPAQHQLAEFCGKLCAAAPTLLPTADWFAPPRSCVVANSKPEPVEPIAWEGGFQELHSLALVNREVCYRLVQRGHPLTILPSNDPRPLGSPLPLPATLEECINRPHDKPIIAHVRHQWPPRWQAPAEGHWVLIQPWEFGSLPKEWITAIEHGVDEVWVPTSWVRKCFINSGVPPERVFVVPNGVDVNLLQSRQPPYPLTTRKRFKFLVTVHPKKTGAAARGAVL